MRRSVFLARSAGVMAALAVPRLPARALAEDTLDYTLTAAPIAFSPAPGMQYPLLAFNGSIPGPVIRVAQGQRLRAKFVNSSGKPATVHWHGMILPNRMDGVEDITQAPVPSGDSFLYDFVAQPAGTRWYHDHVGGGLPRGLFGLIVVEDPNDEHYDAEFALVFHDVPNLPTIEQAMMGVSGAPMVDPIGSPEMREMEPNDKMGDEVAYVAHCINGRSYPATQKLPVKVGQRVRLRVLNANPTQTRYVRLADHRLTVTHTDGNRLEAPVTVDALRIGVAERYDAWFEVQKPGAWLLQGLSSEPTAYQQAAVVYTEGFENAAPAASPQTLEGVEFFTYEGAGGVGPSMPQGASMPQHDKTPQHDYNFTLGGGAYGSNAWTINGKTYPHTPKIFVTRGDAVTIHFKNTTDMDHPMHLHGHVFRLTSVDGKPLLRPLPKDTALVRAHGGTATWHFTADSPPGRWLLHCHNEIHMMDGMRTEVVYRS
ncbi:MAG TPA: multicopper oxidase family protein [Candidatus Baltobacteraceae bacterium]|jgi:FtsP/CotA-like multicopper oxidase with cupredoxin domain|nr:multicopper oxidase family protein [Candidatus Baltobacteraceae bacterium]